MKKVEPPKTVEEYLERIPTEARKALEKVRKAIKAAAPKAEEVISYGIPLYKQNGMLVGLGAAKKHGSLYPGPEAVMQFANELKAYKTAKGTIQFPYDKPMPAALVKKIVKHRIADNEARAIAKKQKVKKK